MSDKALVLIDGGYLDYLQRGFGSARLDYGLMAKATCDHFGFSLLRCVYFNCLPYLSNTPSPEDREAFRKKEGFYLRLQRLDRFEVKLGRLAFRGLDETTGKPVLEQKQVDVLLAIEMVYAATRHSVDAIILLSGDGDFLPSAKLVKREGLTFALVHGPRSGTQLTVQEALWEAADLRLELDMDFLKQLLREG